MKVEGEIHLGIKLEIKKIHSEGFHWMWPFSKMKCVEIILTQKGTPIKGDGHMDLHEGDILNID
jgi:hypothetical protein